MQITSQYVADCTGRSRKSIHVRGKEDRWKCHVSSLKSADLASVPFLSLSRFLFFSLFFSSRHPVDQSVRAEKRERGTERATFPLRPYERNSSCLSTPPPTLSVTLSNSRVTLLPALITSLRNDLLIYRLISRRWLPDVSLFSTEAGEQHTYVKFSSTNGREIQIAQR